MSSKNKKLKRKGLSAQKPGKVKKTGLPPGSIVYTGTKTDDKVEISVINFNEKDFKHEQNCSVSTLRSYVSDDSTTWINVSGIHNTQIVEEIGKEFSIHPLVLEDIVNVSHRPKVEEHQDYIFFTCKLIEENKENLTENPDQISLILGNNWIISFLERPTLLFNNFIERIEQAKGIVRTRKADYIFYRILDIVIDNYFFIVDRSSESLEMLDEAVSRDDNEEISKDLHNFKNQMIKLRKMMLPLREAISSLLRDEFDQISEPVKHYLRDAYEHVLQINENIDNQREMAGGLLDLYMTGISNKMNQIMQVLTMFATIFIPLTFIAGVYGMNFTYMPELQWKYGYAIIWGIMLVVATGFIIYFKRKKWL